MAFVRMSALCLWMAGTCLGDGPFRPPLFVINPPALIKYVFQLQQGQTAEIGEPSWTILFTVFQRQNNVDAFKQVIERKVVVHPSNWPGTAATAEAGFLTKRQQSYVLTVVAAQVKQYWKNEIAGDVLDNFAEATMEKR